MSSDATGASASTARTTAVDDRIDTFGIALPPEWVRFPVDGDFEDFVRGQRRRLADEAQLSKTAQRQFELIMRQLRNDCRRSNVTLAAAMFAVIDEPAEFDDGETVEAGLLAASCTISSLSRAALGSELPLTVNTIAAAMTRDPAADDGVEIVNLDPPAIVDLAAGRAVKLVRLHTHPPSPTTLERLAVFVQHVMVPYDDGERAAVVSFASPTPAYARPLSSLFDAMVGTFRMFGGDTPTDPLAGPAATEDGG